MWRPHFRLRVPGLLLAVGLLASAALATTVPSASQRCQTFTGTASPLTHCPATNYFCTANAVRPLVGVSDDAACHIPVSDPNKCNLSNSKEVLQSLFTNGVQLNKIRLWVSLAGNPDDSVAFTYQHPFTYEGSYWRLDIPNETYFSRLQDVVDYCRLNNITVEITFFAPWEGDYNLGPWNGANGKVCVDAGNNFQPGDATCNTLLGHTLKTAGFSSQGQFVTPGTGFASQVQLNLIQWTIDRLYCYDNVYWEIANEPEAGSVDAVTVSQWQDGMVQKAFAADGFYVGRSPGITVRHTIAVNPSNTTVDYVHGTGNLADVGLVNGHYTELFRNAGNMGAIQLSQRSANAATAASKLLGFNETKISGIAGNAGTLPAGAPDSARAEGWEFMLSRNAVYDHWGYAYSSANGQAARTQMTSLKNFLGTLLLRQLVKSAADSAAVPPTPAPAPAWVPSLPACGTYNATRAARLFWTAMEPSSTATTKQYVLYLHNSLRRCSSGTDPGCTTLGTTLAFNGYNPVITSNNAYQETLSLSLPAGTYTCEWVQPKTNTDIVATSTLTVAAGGSCSGTCSNTGTPCTIKSPSYGYDIALKITQQ